MDYGEASFIVSGLMNQQLLIRSLQYPGFAYKFHRATETRFECSSCKQLGKSRTVTVKNGRIVGYKHPEVGHHEHCRPVQEEEIKSRRASIRKVTAEISRPQHEDSR